MCQDSLSEILHVVFQGRQRGRLVMVLEAYFDETGGKGIPHLFIAGYLSDFTRWQNFRTKWSELLHMCGDIPYFRMYDCLSGKGVFAHLRSNPILREEYAKLAIEIIKPSIAVGLVVDFDTDVFDDLATPKFRKIWGDAYTFGTSMCLDRLSVRPEVKSLEGEIVYVFEQGAPGWKRTDARMHGIANDPDLKRKYRYKNHLFLAKEEAYPLQAADCFANLFFKSYREDQKLKQLHPLMDKLVNESMVPHIWDPFGRTEMPKLFADTMRHHDVMYGTQYTKRLGDWRP